MKSAQKLQPSVSLYSAGGEASGDEAHTLLSDALWESFVQQPSVEELEHKMSSTNDHHWKQLQWHEGQVCTRHHCER